MRVPFLHVYFAPQKSRPIEAPIFMQKRPHLPRSRLLKRQFRLLRPCENEPDVKQSRAMREAEKLLSECLLQRPTEQPK